MEAKFLDIGGSKTLRLAARESAEAAIEGALPLPAGIRLGDIEPLCAAARVEAAAATAHDGRIDIEGKLKVQFSKKPALYWIAIGKTDFLYKANEDYRKMLDEKGYKYSYYETGEGHIWKNWRIYLTEFAPQLFK